MNTNSKTILITGCSSGFGNETAKLFLEKGWNVIATMRKPDPSLLPASKNLKIIELDITKEDSILTAIEQAGPIDALVNNAGIGLLSPLEANSIATHQKIILTNTLGTISMTQAVLPQFRSQGGGVIVNISSAVTYLPVKFLSVYSASKAAVNAFSKSLALEVEPFNIRIRIVRPGASPETSFGKNAQVLTEKAPEAYTSALQEYFQALQNSNASYTHAIDVANAVWNAVNDPSKEILDMPAGADAEEWRVRYE